MDQTTNVNETVAPKAASKSIRDDDVIVVKSLVPNIYYTCSKTMDSFIWADVGDVQEMTFAQLKVLNNKHGGYFTKKWLYPLNDVVLKKLGIDDIFAVKFDSHKDMKLLYGNDVNAVKEKISYIATEDKDAMIKKVQNAVKQGKIVNIKIIRLLEKELDIELMDLV